MRVLTIIVALLLTIGLIYDGTRAMDPYEPAPGAYDGLTAEQITNLEAEREAARLIDEEVSRGGERVIVMEATAYTWTGQRTASGTWPAVGTVAVDPQVIPLGTKLYIEGYGPAVALDTGGLVKGNIIDVYLPTEDECWQWGQADGGSEGDGVKPGDKVMVPRTGGGYSLGEIIEIYTDGRARVTFPIGNIYRGKPRPLAGMGYKTVKLSELRPVKEDL